MGHDHMGHDHCQSPSMASLEEKPKAGEKAAGDDRKRVQVLLWSGVTGAWAVEVEVC